VFKFKEKQTEKAKASRLQVLGKEANA